MQRTVREAPKTTLGWKRESQSIFDADRFRHAGTLIKQYFAMKVEYSCCAGLDVHKRLVVACVLKGEPGQEPVSETKSFCTTTCELMEMVEWLKSHGITHAAMEATGNFWMPVYNLLEGHFELIVTNAAHMKAVPGRTSDVQHAAWIAELLRHGLLKASLIPSRQQRDLRELTRHRSSLAGKRAQAANEPQKALESANIKLQSVVSDITGVSSTEMLEELVAGKSDPKDLAQLAKRRLRPSTETLNKFAHHRGGTRLEIAPSCLVPCVFLSLQSTTLLAHAAAVSRGTRGQYWHGH